MRIVNPGTPAADADLRVADRITPVDGRPAAQVDFPTFRRTLEEEGRSIRLGVRRGEEALEVMLVLRPILQSRRGRAPC